jgi:hypothetical protein
MPTTAAEKRAYEKAYQRAKYRAAKSGKTPAQARSAGRKAGRAAERAAAIVSPPPADPKRDLAAKKIVEALYFFGSSISISNGIFEALELLHPEAHRALADLGECGTLEAFWPEQYRAEGDP